MQTITLTSNSHYVFNFFTWKIKIINPKNSDFCKFWPLSLNPSKSRKHFYGRFHRPLALLIHHWTLLSSAVQVRSLYCCCNLKVFASFPALAISKVSNFAESIFRKDVCCKVFRIFVGHLSISKCVLHAFLEPYTHWLRLK